MVFKQADPPMGDSISIHRRYLGSKYFCEEIFGLAPADTIVQWQDGDNSTLVLRPSPKTNPKSSYSSEIGRIHGGSTRGGVWDLGKQTICKVSSWTSDKQLEGRTIAFVKEKIPNFPIPEVIYDWVDESWNRTFMVMKRAPGQELETVLSTLTNAQLKNVARQTAHYMKELMQYTSPRFETVDGLGHDSDTLLSSFHVWETWPSWKPDIHPTYTPESLSKLLQGQSGITPPDFETPCFTHPDLNGFNIFVYPDGNLAAIIDWEDAGYWPSYWVATIPQVNPFFCLNNNRWKDALCYFLKQEGFRDESKWFKKHQYAISQKDKQDEGWW